MHDYCPVCGQHYEPEPGFFWGAMYVSYAFSVAIVVAVGLAVYVLGHDPDTWVYIVSAALAIVLFMPLTFRYSRLVMLYLFGGIDYNPAAPVRQARR